MKKVFTNLFLLASLLVAGGVSAQVFYTEDFANGMPAGWTTADPSNNDVQWKYCAADSVCVALYGHPAPATTTVGNGLMYLDSDGAGQLTTNHKSQLTTAAIDCSGKPKVFLLVDMLFMVYSTTSHANLRVSNDGVTWTDFTIPYTLTDYNDNAGNLDHVTDNPAKPAVNISSVAANKPTVYIQWEFDGNFDFWWFLDDVKLTTVDPTPPVNMKISSYFYPLTHYRTPDFAVSKDTFGFSCNVTNSGGVDQTALIVKAVVTNDANGNVLFQDSLITNGLAAGVDSQFIFNKRFAPELPAGKYSVRYRCYVPGFTDATPGDNVASKDFIISGDGSWARDDANASNLTFTQPGTINADGWATINLFQMLGGSNEKYHIQDVEWRAGKTGGMDGVKAEIYVLEVNDDNVAPDWSGFDPANLPFDDNTPSSYTWIGGTSFEYLDTTTGNTPKIRTGVSDFFNGNPGIDVKQGKRYLIAVSWEGDNTDIFHAFVTDVPYSNINTFIYNAPTWFGGFSGGEYTAYTRCYVYLGSKTDDKPLPDAALSVFPNPTSDMLNLSLNFEKPTSVTITLADMKGGVISVMDKEGLTNETLSYDLSGYAAGTYIARIATPDGTKTKEFVVSKDEGPREGLGEIRPLADQPLDRQRLPVGAPLHPEPAQLFRVADAARPQKARDPLGHSGLQRRPPRHDDPEADHRLGMQPLEILQIPVEKRVLVVPLDLERQHPARPAPHMIDLVGDRLLDRAVHGQLQLELVLEPALFGQRPAQPLRRGRLAPARADKLGQRDREAPDRRDQLRRLGREIDRQDGLGMVARQQVEPVEPIEKAMDAHPKENPSG